jgi:hypothetical protein
MLPTAENGIALQHRDLALTYEEALRVIGRHLDAEPAYGVKISEVQDGYLVRFQPAYDRPDEHINHFSWERIRDLVVFFSSGRGLVRKQGRYQGMWAKLPNGHQGFLRALGFSLDKEQASDFTLEEEDDAVNVRYARPSSDEPSDLEYVSLHITEAEIKKMLTSANQRRG